MRRPPKQARRSKIKEVSVAKIGTGTNDDPIHPDTSAERWRWIDETETEMTIEILDNDHETGS